MQHVNAPGKGRRFARAASLWVMLWAPVLVSAAPPGPDDQTPVAARLASLGDRLQRLEDANQIENVQRTYGYFVDKAMWHEVSDLFAEDGTYEIGGRGVFVGRRRVLEYLMVGLAPERPVEGRLYNHMTLQPIVHVDPDGLHAHVRARAWVMSSGGWGDAMYENELVKEGGVWKFSKVRGPFHMYGPMEGWAKTSVPNTRPDSFLPPPDRPPTVVYLAYPSVYIVPFDYPNPVTGHPWKGDPRN
jgi:hypothetical protein